MRDRVSNLKLHTAKETTNLSIMINALPIFGKRDVIHKTSFFKEIMMQFELMEANIAINHLS